MPMGKGTYGSKVGRPPNKMMYGGKVKKMKDGGKLKMVDRNGKSVPFYANDGVGKMNKGGKVQKMAAGGMTASAASQLYQPPKFTKPSEKMRGMNADDDKAEGEKVANEINSLERPRPLRHSRRGYPTNRKSGKKPKTTVVAEYDVGVKGSGRKSKQTSGKKVPMNNK